MRSSSVCVNFEVDGGIVGERFVGFEKMIAGGGR